MGKLSFIEKETSNYQLRDMPQQYSQPAPEPELKPASYLAVPPGDKTF